MAEVASAERAEGGCFESLNPNRYCIYVCGNSLGAVIGKGSLVLLSIMVTGPLGKHVLVGRGLLGRRLAEVYRGKCQRRPPAGHQKKNHQRPIIFVFCFTPPSPRQEGPCFTCVEKPLNFQVIRTSACGTGLDHDSHGRTASYRGNSDQQRGLPVRSWGR